MQDKVRKRQKLDWDKVKNDKKVAAVSLSVKKGDNMFIIMVSRDMDVVINFGSEHWINFLELFEMGDKIDDENYQKYINNEQNRKNYRETKEIIDNAGDFTDIAEKFYNDFRTDRGNRIRLDLVEGESKEEAEKLKEAFGGRDEQ